MTDRELAKLLADRYESYTLRCHREHLFRVNEARFFAQHAVAIAMRRCIRRWGGRVPDPFISAGVIHVGRGGITDADIALAGRAADLATWWEDDQP